MSGVEAISFPIGRYRLRFDTQAETHRGYQGSAWRGAFGHALKRMVCVTGLPRCADCILKGSCVYPYLFESPLPADATKMRRYRAVPHPLVIALPSSDTNQSDGHFHLSITLFGRANQHLPYVIHALRQAGENGIGRRRVQHSLLAVEQTTCLDHEWRRIYLPDGALTSLSPVAPMIPEPPKSIKVRLLSPLRIKYAGHLMGAEGFSFAGFFVNLLRRISMLTYFYTDSPLEVEFKTLAEAARAVPVLESALEWRELTRYSLRQQTAMGMGGLTGEFELPRAGIEPFWPYLWLGQWTHVGKFTSMGLGQYRIAETASLPQDTNAIA